MTMEKPHGLAKQTLFRSSSTQQGAKLLLLSCMVLTVPACNTLPKQIPQTPVYAFDLPTDQTSLGKIVLPLRVNKIQALQVSMFSIIHSKHWPRVSISLIRQKRP